jgi:Ser/Thr protein kinase RdoA (MazF antagonist)
MQIVKIAEQFETGALPHYARSMAAGSVNESYLVDLSDGTSLVLQKINADMFPQPDALMRNIQAVTGHLDRAGCGVGHLFFARTAAGGLLYRAPDGSFWRAYRYVAGPVDDQNTPMLAAKLGHSIGAFHRSLTDFPVETLAATAPHYHNTPRYFSQFEAALASAPQRLKNQVSGELEFLRKQGKTCSALIDMGLPARVTFNDVTPSNMVLDPETGTPKCLLDYDLIMPGVLAFDFGEGVRSCCHTCREDEREMPQVRFHMDMFSAYTKGFMAQAMPIMEADEPGSLALGCVVMTLERGLRYMADYLSGSKVFPVEYPEHNLNRARVQLYLCIQMQDIYRDMCAAVRDAFQAQLDRGRAAETAGL